MATETLRPDAIGDETALTPSAGANWECVDEETPDEAGTTVYHSTVATWKRDLYNLPAHSVGSGTINSVKVYCRCYVLAGSANAKCILKSNSTVTEGSSQAISGSWVTYSEQWNDNPADSAWEWADIDALQIGVSLLPAGAVTPRCTQVYVEVDYTPPAVIGPFPTHFRV